MSDTSDNYLQFPLCALAYGQKEYDRLEHILSYSFVHYGLAIVAKMDTAARKDKLAEIQQSSSKPRDFAARHADHLAVMVGAGAVGINTPCVSRALERWGEVSAYRDAFEAKYGRDVDVRVAKNLVFEARDNRGITYRELAVLVAVYSCIGAKRYPVRVTRSAIRCRMLGYKSERIMQAELPSRTDGAVALSLSQINRLLNRLHERQFFARARANERQTFYSHRLTQDRLENALVEGKSYSQDFHQRRRLREAALMERIRQSKLAIKVTRPIKVSGDGQSSLTYRSLNRSLTAH